MSLIYPDLPLQELYIQHQSVWEEVWAGLSSPEDALIYMQVDRDSDLWELAYAMLLSGEDPL